MQSSFRIFLFAHLGILASKTGSLPEGPDIAGQCASTASSYYAAIGATKDHIHLLDFIGCICDTSEPTATQPNTTNARACLQFQQVALEHTILDSLDVSIMRCHYPAPVLL